MQAGFSCLESGLVRSKNSINVAAKNFADFCLASAVFWLFGFALMFGATSGGIFGTSGFLFDDTANPWLMAFFIFQLGFCGTAVTIVSGAVSERMRFAGYLVIATILSAVIYPVIGHWVWGSASGASSGGWLEQRGFIDFAGSTVVHSVGGWIALAAIIIIGPRIGRFGENSVPIHGHDLPFVTLGVFLLWFGWFGFNGGSTLGLTPEVPVIIVNTTVSGAFGGLVALALAWRLGGRPDVAMIMNGSLAGLVGITASAHIMTPVAAAGIGCIAAVIMYGVAMLLEKLEIDDVVGAVPVHLAAGIWGTLAVAIFGDPETWGTGLGRWDQLVVQATGVGATFLWAFGLGFILLWLINRVFPLRIDPEGERVGLNVAEHGASTEILDLLTEMDAQRRANDFSQPVNVEPHTEIGQIAQQYNRVIADINAEQRRREAATEALLQKTLSLELLQGAAAAANRAQTVHDAIQTCLEDISRFGGWAVGHCYMLDDATGELASAKIWHFDDAERFATFREVTENTTFESGAGLPGQVMASRDPAWIVDVSEDPNFIRGQKAEDLGVKGAAAFPVLVEEDVVAVLEFFSREPVEPNETMLEVMASVGTQLGRVVERRRSEAARFKSVVDNMPAHVHLRDQDGRFILINRKYEEFYGITNDSARGKTLDEIHLDESFDIELGKAGVHDRQVIESNSIVEDNFTVTRKGVKHTIADVKFPVRDHSGEIIAVGGIELDITELKRAEEAVRESQQLLETILDHMPTPVYLRDLEGRFLLINRTYEKRNEVTKDGVNGKTLDEIFPKDVAEDYRTLDPEVIKEGRVLEREETHHVTAGDRIVQVVKFPVFDLTGEVMAVGGIDIDITERKRAEEALAEKEAQLRVALDNMPGGMLMFDKDHRVIILNDQYRQLLDIPEDLVVEGSSAERFIRYQAERGDFGPGDVDDLVGKVMATLMRRESARYERRLSSGRAVEISVAPTPEGGNVAVYNDITDRKRAEEELQAAHGIIKDQKERMEEELNVGHEIQMSMIPLKFPPFPDHDEFSIYAALEPAREVGGDFYDYYFLDEERFCFCIGDVSGKGVPAALFMAMTKTLIKSRATDDRSTASILTHVNDELSQNNKSCMFVTIFAGILNVKTGKLLYTNAGHNPPYIRRKDGTLQRLDKRHGPAIAAMEGMVYKEERDILEPGDLLFLYTDGVTEAMDIDHHLFSEDRLMDLLASLDTDDADTAVDDTVTAVRAFEGEAEQADDITVLGLRYQGKAEDALMAEQRITIKNRMPEIAAVNETFEAFAEEFGIPATIAMKFNVIFDELLNNIVTYAYSDDDEHDIEVRMELAGKRLTVTITDDGVPFNPLSEEAPDIDASLEEREIGGLGIHVVRNLIDDVNYNRRIGENVMTLTRHLE
jgi:ammonium transporter